MLASLVVFGRRHAGQSAPAMGGRDDMDKEVVAATTAEIEIKG